MTTLMNVLTNEYFPAASVLSVVVIFWTIALLGGLSLLTGHQPPLATLGWLLFVYAAVVLSPIAGFLALADLVRRWWRNRRTSEGTAAPDTTRP
jgi:hypothetical protein